MPEEVTQAKADNELPTVSKAEKSVKEQSVKQGSQVLGSLTLLLFPRQQEPEVGGEVQ